MTAPKGLRRVVTSLDSDGRAIILFDGENPHMEVRPARKNVSRVVWASESAPAEIQGNIDRGLDYKGTSPVNGGSVFRIIDYPPQAPEIEKMDINTRMNELTHEAPIKGLPPRHPFMHRTRSLDYAIVLYGEIDMLVDDGEVHLKAGDVIVQQGTNHAWVNRSNDICRIAVVLVDAKAPD
ncbi:MAG: cupin domain-containing protein [Beijerinckiaceae bacterium]